MSETVNIFRQHASVYRYVALKRIRDIIPAVSILVASRFGLEWAAFVLGLSLLTGSLTDLQFFHALSIHNGSGRNAGAYALERSPGVDVRESNPAVANPAPATMIHNGNGRERGGGGTPLSSRSLTEQTASAAANPAPATIIVTKKKSSPGGPRTWILVWRYVRARDAWDKSDYGPAGDYGTDWAKYWDESDYGPNGDEW